MERREQTCSNMFGFPRLEAQRLLCSLGVRPNTVVYNGVIAACSGGQASHRQA